MTELRDKTDSTTPPPPGSASAPTGEPDPLHNLYRMSRTAGLGSGDYVAINNTAIVALLLGFASVLALLYPVMLIVALAAVICGVIALMQIRSSSGTQTGRGLAAAGITLAVVLGGVGVGRIVLANMEQRRDEQEIDKVVQRLSEYIAAKQYSQAYQTLFSDDFKKDFSEQTFAQRWESFVPHFGEVKEIGWGRRAEFQVVRATNTKRAFAASYVRFEKFDEPARQPITFVLRDGEWEIDALAQLFDKPTPQRPGPPPMPDPRAPLGPEMFDPNPPDAAAPGPG